MLGVFYVREDMAISTDSFHVRQRSGESRIPGNDDHPVTRTPNQRSIAGRFHQRNSQQQVLAESAIIITYDETDGLYDHTQPQIRSIDPLGTRSTRATDSHDRHLAIRCRSQRVA